ncbi:MAG: hypothetical protein ABI551_17835, partial [Polyangiaceae bacterium]
VFALALVLEEVVAGKSPMSGDTSQMFLIASNTELRPTLKTMGVDETDAVEKVLLKALAVEPKERYADANAFWTALRHAVESGDTVLSQRAEPAPTRREGSAAARVTTKPLTAELAKPPSGRALQMAVAGLLFLIGLGGVYVIRGGDSPLFRPELGDAGNLPAYPRQLAENAEAPVIVPANATAPQTPGFQRYANEKYNFVIDVPVDFTQYDEASTGDGRTYKTADGQASLRIVGHPLVGGIDDLYKTEVMRDTHELGRWLLPSATRTPDMFVLVGYEHDTIPFTEKVIVTGGIYAEMVFSYPPAMRPRFEPMVPHVRDSFSFTAVSNTAPQPAPVADAGAVAAAPQLVTFDDGTSLVLVPDAGWKKPKADGGVP